MCGNRKNQRGSSLVELTHVHDFAAGNGAKFAMEIASKTLSFLQAIPLFQPVRDHAEKESRFMNSLLSFSCPSSLVDSIFLFFSVSYPIYQGRTHNTLKAVRGEQ